MRMVLYCKHDTRLIGSLQKRHESIVRSPERLARGPAQAGVDADHLVAKHASKGNPASNTPRVLFRTRIIVNGQVISRRDGANPNRRMPASIENLRKVTFVHFEDVIAEVPLEVLNGVNAKVLGNKRGETLGCNDVVQEKAVNAPRTDGEPHRSCLQPRCQRTPHARETRGQLPAERAGHSSILERAARIPATPPSRGPPRERTAGVLP